MATPILPRDFPRYTMAVLEAALERDDPKNARVAAQALLRSSFNHLFAADFYDASETTDPGVGLAMCELLVLTGERP